MSNEIIVANPNSPKAAKQLKAHLKWNYDLETFSFIAFFAAVVCGATVWIPIIMSKNIILYPLGGLSTLAVFGPIIYIYYVNVHEIKDTITVPTTFSYGSAHQVVSTNLKDIRTIRDRCIGLMETTDSKFISSSINRVIETIPYFQWEIASFYEKASRFYVSGTSETKQAITDKYESFTRYLEKYHEILACLTDIEFKSIVWNNPEDHLSIIKQEVHIMVSALEEAQLASAA